MKKTTFSFQAVIRRHARMLFDWRRTAPLLRAIARTIQPGDVVVDIGCGLGFLSFAALHAGAAKVYAIDVETAALDFARWQAAQLGLQKKIIFFNDHSFHVDLPEKADLLIQETIGPLAFDENFLPTLQDAKKRFLKPGAKIIPEAVLLVGAPVEALGKRPVDRRKKLLAKPSVLVVVNTKKTTVSEISLSKNFAVKNAKGLKNFRGILVWPHIVWAKNCVTDASPLKPHTHWKQTLLEDSLRQKSKSASSFRLELNIRPDPLSPLDQTEILWKIKKS